MNVLRTRARQLRKDPTHAERLLWQKLRFWQVDGCKFRRQQPLGNYIVDFVCLQKRLIIELDGGQHAESLDYDREHDAWRHDQGFVVLRFWHHDVLNNTEGVVERILQQLKAPPISVLPRNGKEVRN
jgi:very-short-patch-repair endonuclease